MLAGARQILTKPLVAEELVTTIRQVYEKEAARRPHLAPGVGAEGGRAAAPGLPETRLGHICAVYSPKGGVGRTTIAANLAVALQQQTGAKVALVDASLVFGDVAIVLNIPPKRTIVDLVPVIDQLDAELLESTMARHQSGISVLLAPSRPEMAELVAPQHLRYILTLLRSMFDYIIVDTWASFHEQVLGVLDMAERIIVVSTLEMHAIKNLRLFLEVTEALNYPPEKLVLVLNRADSSGGMRAQDVENNLKRKFAAQIANDWRLATLSVNEGAPFVTTHPQSQLAQDVSYLATVLSGKPLPSTNGYAGARSGGLAHDKKPKGGWRRLSPFG
jgi:pilus assembly protein CpaE